MIGRKKQEKELSKLEKRVANMATPDLTAWAEQALYGIGRSLSSYQRTHEIADLDEADLGAEALHVVTRELKARRQ